MDINRFKRAASGTTVVAVCLATSWVVAQAVPSSPMDALLKTQREVTVTALETAIARGDDGIGPLPGFYLPDDADMQEDDPLVRALWQRLNNGPISQQSVVHLLQETDNQRQREQAYST